MCCRAIVFYTEELFNGVDESLTSLLLKGVVHPKINTTGHPFLKTFKCTVLKLPTST